MVMSKKRPLIIAVVLSSVLLFSSCQLAQTEDNDLDEAIRSLTVLVEEQGEQITRLDEDNQVLFSLITEKDEQIAVMEEEKQTLTELVAELEAEIQRIGEPQSISRAPNDGWEEYFPGVDQSTLTGETTDVIEELLGTPPYIIRSTAFNPEYSREIWVYTPYQEDPTGLYLFFQDSVLTESRLDEFQGFFGSGLLDLEDFWW